jgi:hypothetical protein
VTTVATAARQALPADPIRLLAFAAVLAAINGVSTTIFASFEGFGWRGALLDLSGVSAVYWFALYALVTLSRASPTMDAAVEARTADRWVAALVMALALWPSARAGAVGVLISALYLARCDDPRARPIAVILFALSGMLVVGQLLLVFAGPALLTLDARFVALLAGVESSGTTVRFTGHDGLFAIAVPCSSVHNVSLAVILWASLTQLLGFRVTPRLIGLCGAAMATMVLVNGVRLAAIAHYHGSFDWLHVGGGAQLFGWASLVAAGLVIAGGLLLLRDERA